MKKVFRLVSVCLIPGLMLVFINVGLAGPPVSKSRASELAGQTAFNPWTGRIPANRGLLQIEPITGLSITHSLPAFINSQIIFTATRSGGSLPIFYSWSFGDGVILPFDAGAVVSHSYVTTGTYTVVVTALNFAGTFTQPASITVEEAPFRAFLPIVWKEASAPVEPSDLVCDLSIDPPTLSPGQTFVISVKIQNLQGGSADGFWVDLYINPTKVPTQGNLFPWPDACNSPSCPGGIAWGISNAPLAPGITRTLVSIPKNFHPDGFDPVYSKWTGSLLTGTYKLYAYADSITNPEFKDREGAVLETNEDNNRCELLDLVIPAANITGIDQRPSNPLPVR